MQGTRARRCGNREDAGPEPRADAGRGTTEASMARTHTLSRAGAAALGTKGALGERAFSPDCGSNAHLVWAWFGGEVERQFSKRSRAGSKGWRSRPLVGPSVETLAAFNRRTVDLWVARGERHLLGERSNTDLFAWLGRAQCPLQPSALGDGTGSAATPFSSGVVRPHTACSIP